MQRIISAASAAVLILTAGAASAQVIPDQGEIVFGANVTPQCNLTTGPSYGQVIDVNAAFPGGLINSDGYINGTPNTTLVVADLSDYFESIWCNSAGATITLAGTRLTSSNGPAGGSGASNWAGSGFDHEISLIFRGLAFSAVVPANAPVWQGGNSLSTGADQTSKQANATTWFEADVIGEIGIWNDPTRRPIAGAYSATWTLTITPAS